MKSRITIEEVGLAPNIPEVIELARLSSYETDTEAPTNELLPWLEIYLSAEEKGCLLLITARDGLRLAGYSVNFMVVNAHYSQEQICMNDSLFVHQDYRKGYGLGLALLKETAQYAKLRGAKHFMQSAKKGSRMERILPRWGFELEETLYRRTL